MLRIQTQACALYLLAVLCTAQPVANSTVMEATLDDLRSRFPNQLVFGFEELWDERGNQDINLGSPDSTLQQLLQRARVTNPRYKIDLRSDGLVHLYPARGTADPAHLLDIRLKEFRLPPDHCIQWAIENLDRGSEPGSELVRGPLSYAPELSKFVREKKKEWYLKQGRHEPVVGGFMGGGLGSCDPVGSHPDTYSSRMYHNITVRDAMNLMAVRSLKLSRKEVQSDDPQYGGRGEPISWKFRFRRDPDADSGLGGVPVFQTF